MIIRRACRVCCRWKPRVAARPGMEPADTRDIRRALDRTKFSVCQSEALM
jgi:hypothetical protein